MAQRRPYKARKDSKAGDPTAKVKCCRKEHEDASRDCDINPENKENKTFIDKQEKRNKRRRTNKNKKGKLSPKPEYSVRNMTWKDKHCQKLLFDYEKPHIIESNINKVKEELETLVEDLKERLPQDFLDKLESQNKSIDACIQKDDMAKSALCLVVLRMLGTMDAVMGGIALSEQYDKYKEMLQKLSKEKDKILPLLKDTKELKVLNSKIKDAKGDAKKVLQAKQSKLKDSLKEKKDAIYAQTKIAIAKDECIKSKRCELKPYNQKSNIAEPIDRKQRISPTDKIFGLHKQGGCCPGQQAHHVIAQTKLLGCPNYQKNGDFHKGAPTVCVEGGHSTGTHGEMHSATDTNTEDMVHGEGEYENHTCAKQADSMACTIEASAAAYVQTFSDSKCDKECIKQQLEKYYKKYKDCKMTAKNKNGDEIKKSDENNGNEDV